MFEPPDMTTTVRGRKYDMFRLLHFIPWQIIRRDNRIIQRM